MGKSFITRSFTGIVFFIWGTMTYFPFCAVCLCSIRSLMNFHGSESLHSDYTTVIWVNGQGSRQRHHFMWLWMLLNSGQCIFGFKIFLNEIHWKRFAFCLWLYGAYWVCFCSAQSKIWSKIVEIIWKASLLWKFNKFYWTKWEWFSLNLCELIFILYSWYTERILIYFLSLTLASKSCFRSKTGRIALKLAVVSEKYILWWPILLHYQRTVMSYCIILTMFKVCQIH